MLYGFWSSVTTFISVSCPLINWPLCHYERTLFIPGNIFCSKIFSAGYKYNHFGFLFINARVKYLFLNHFIFNLFRCLYLKWVSHRQRMVRSSFFIQFDNLWLLFGVLRPFTFNVMITIDELKPTILVVCVLFVLCVFWIFFFFSYLPFRLFAYLRTVIWELFS